MKSPATAAATALLIASCPAAFAQQSPLVKVEADATRTELNRTLNVTITVGSPGDKIWCGAIITFGDGESRELRIDQSPYTLQKAYKSTGSYTISVVGKFIGRFLKSANGCTGSIASDHILVEDGSSAAAAAGRASEAEFAKLKAELDRLHNAPEPHPAPPQPAATHPSEAVMQVKPAPAPAPVHRKPSPPPPSASDAKPI